MSDYNSHLRYEMPEPAGPYRRPVWQIVLLSIGGTVLVLGLAANYLGPQLLGMNRFNEGLPPASVVLGTPVRWRVLQQRRVTLADPQGSLGGMLSANFDADPDDELLVIGSKGSSLFEMNGRRRSVALKGDEFLTGVFAWDWNGDGISEVMPDPMMYNIVTNKAASTSLSLALPTEAPVFDLDGRKVVTLPGGALMTEVMFADFDGDGNRDVVLGNPGGNNQAVVFGTQGVQLGVINQPERSLVAAAADLEGDGTAELIFQTMRPHKLLALGLNGGLRELPPGSVTISAAVVDDLNGDGRDDLLSNTAQLYFGGGERTQLLRPPGFDLLMLMPGHAAVLDFDGDGKTDIALAAGDIGIGSELLVFDTAGRCKYHERLGSMIFGVQSATAGGRDYLILQLADRILIYP